MLVLMTDSARPIPYIDTIVFPTGEGVVEISDLYADGVRVHNAVALVLGTDVSLTRNSIKALRNALNDIESKLPKE